MALRVGRYPHPLLAELAIDTWLAYARALRTTAPQGGLAVGFNYRSTTLNPTAPTMKVKRSFRWEPLASVLAEPNARELIRDYAAELSPLRDELPVDPDWDAMAAMEARGEYRIWACRVDGALAGYISFLIKPHHDYRGVLMAQDMGHYLAPAYRNTPGNLGLRMWRSAEAALRVLGARYIIAHGGQRSLLPFFLHLGYNPMATLYLKVL